MLEATGWFREPDDPTHGDRKYINAALLYGNEQEGASGEDASPMEGDRRYLCTFWLKSTVLLVSVWFLGWEVGREDKEGSKLRGYPSLIQASNQRKRCSATFHT